MNTPLSAEMRNPSLSDPALVERQRQKSVEPFRALIEHSSDLITTLTPDGLVRYASPSSKQLLGYAQETWVGVNLFSYVHPDDERTVRAAFVEVLEHFGSTRRGEFRFLHCDGSWRVLEAIITGARSETGEVSLIMSARDVSERVAQTAALRHQTLHDALTDLPNRVLFRESLQQAILDAHCYKKPLALLLLDLDRFREINDTFGHHWGDTLLQQVSIRLRSVLRKFDHIARLGGDEFAVFLSNAGDATSAVRVATRILNVLEHTFVVDGHTLTVGASIGIALFPEHGEDADTLMRRADIAMYAAKRASSGYAFYEPEQDCHSPDRLLLAGELRQAIESNQVLLYYQPKASFATGRVAHVEALVRWRHPQRGLVLPDQFIPLAEQTGLIRPLCLWVLNEALRQCALWKHEGVGLHVAVNLSMRNLQDPRLPDTIAKLLARWSLEPSWLEVEITESALAADPERALDILTRLSDMGVQILIDDFGTGYSSLAYLKRLPVDEIKIDKSFVLGMAADDNDAAIVRSTIDLGHSLGLKVVAEGVEDQATWDLLASLGCDLAQGYFLSRPLPAPDFTAWLRRSARGEGVPLRVLPSKTHKRRSAGK
ncbi:MAG TPA: EAL domain-containing protein [Methylomirabilota bacterium]|nr:EAL domain-containing protein [Methylomirabilota bacterium]